jgi:predicted phage terminase large subunit-like protein
MNTRWHEDDVAGRILKQIDAGVVRGRSITLRAIAEDDDPLGRELGEYLWDDTGYRYGDFLRQRQAEVSPMMWSALYQQRPTPEQGIYFLKEWLHYYEKEPPLATLEVYGASDYAVTADGGDYTVHIVVGIDPQDRMYVLDIWRNQTSSDVWVERFCDLVKDYSPTEWAEEKGQIEAGVGPWLTKRMHERETYVVRSQFPTRGDKAVRPSATLGLYVPLYERWTEPFVAELLSFPAGKNDDQVDALGLVGQLLERIQTGREARKEVPAARDKYRRKDDPDYDGGGLNWKTM